MEHPTNHDATAAHLADPIDQGGHGIAIIPSGFTAEEFHAKYHWINQPVLDHHHGGDPARQRRPDPDQPARSVFDVRGLIRHPPNNSDP